MLLWMMLEPNMFSEVKWGARNFMYLDIYDLFNQEYMNSMNVEHNIEGQFVWTEGTGGIFTPEAYEQFANTFSRIFLYRDIRYFLGFHNHEVDSRFDNIIDYIMDKVSEFFRFIGSLNKDSKLFDLRY